MKTPSLCSVALFLGISLANSQEVTAPTSVQDNLSSVKQRQVEHPPFVVNVIQPPKTDEEKTEERADRERKSLADDKLVKFTGQLASYTFWLFLATLVLAGGTLGLGWFAYRQLRDTRESLAIAKQSSYAAMKSSAALLASERAYVFAEVQLTALKNSAMVGGREWGTVEATVKFWNYGKTPAVVTMIRGYIEILDKAPNELIAFNGSERALPPSLGIGTDCAYEISLDTKLSLEQFPDIKNWNKKIFIVGKMEYRTVLEDNCVTSFCWEITYRDVGSTVTISRDSRLNTRT